jgi:hypothetical protein
MLLAKQFMIVAEPQRRPPRLDGLDGTPGFTSQRAPGSSPPCQFRRTSFHCSGTTAPEVAAREGLSSRQSSS